MGQNSDGRRCRAYGTCDLIETLLIFALGFLSAGFIAVAAAPAIWARAVALTKRRIEATVPLTLNELQADKDQQRAEFAMTARKLELSVKSAREKLTVAQVEVTRLEGELRLLESQRDQLNGTLAEKNALIDDLADQLKRRGDAVSALEARQAELMAALEDKVSELHDRQLEISNLRIDADSRRIELATQLTEREQLAGEISEAKNARSSVEQSLRSTANQLRAAQEAQSADRRRIAELEKKTNRMTALLSDREDRLDRREKELDRLKDTLKAATSERNDAERRYAAAERQRAHLESQNSGLSQRIAKMASISTPGTADKAIKALEAERARLMETVERLTREKAALQDGARRTAMPARVAGSGNELLREKIHELTAKIVQMTAEAEGSASPIPALLAKQAKGPAATAGAKELPVSLAARIKALEHAARRS